MGLFDYDEVEDIIIDDFKRKNENIILSNSDYALSLIGKIISPYKNFFSQRNIEKLDDLIDDAFLASLSRNNIKITNEAQMQIRLTQLSDKLMEQKKHQILLNRSIIGIGGKFSAGKSKFINSILRAGEELLPEDQNPTTSIPTFIVYGEDERITAYSKENEEIILSIEEMQALTHKFYTEYKIGFSSFIDGIIISEPDLPFKNLVFLDTPGYSKADNQNDLKIKTQKDLSDQNKAYEQLKAVDFLIWIVDIENGVLSDSDIDFISKIKISTPILFVANKADKKTSSEIQSIVETIEESAKDAGISLYGVTAYSSRDNIEYNSENMITSFLDMARKKKADKDDLIAQINEIDSTISLELNNNIDDKINERDSLSRVIYNSDNIMEIKSLVDIYGDIVQSIRDMRSARYEYQRTIKSIRKMLNIHYGENR